LSDLHNTSRVAQDITLEELKHQLDVLIGIGASLSTEHDQNVLLENIVTHAKMLTGADAATLYLMVENDTRLKFEIAHTDSMNFRMGGTSGLEIPWYPVKLYLDDGSPNEKMVSAYVALTGKSLNFPDVYDVEGFDFAGTKAFDQKNNYRTTSMLTIPMKNHEAKIIGVLQLINAQDPESRKTVPFSSSAQHLVESMASQAAVAITQNRLIEGLEELFNSFIRVIASAIDEKSKYTGGHIERVAELTLMIARYINETQDGLYGDIRFNEDEMDELRIAAWLHDIGKITTPEYVVDKATKLETIFDRIHIVRLRIETLIAQTERDYYKALADGSGNAAADGGAAALAEKIAQYRDDLAFLEKINFGGEFMAPELKARVDEIAAISYRLNGEEKALLEEDEVENLKIARGTLNDEERQIINNHVVVTIKMLSQLPFPDKLSRVVEYAGGHHEKLDGSGYPNMLKADELSLPARIMAVADIFEALTAADRPYKKAKSLSEAMKIMGFMAKDFHIDPELFEFFKSAGIHRDYAENYMKPEQIDEV